MKDVSKSNSLFWNELCGTQMARQLGIHDDSSESLAKFDRWYFQYYPYLDKYIQFSQCEGRDVLEVGLGYGSVSQRLAESGCRYHGLDIAKGPVSMVRHRLKQSGFLGSVIQGSILDPPFPDGSFDIIVAIGCLHHTGNLPLAIQRCHELLRPGGRLIFMVYYAYSYRRWYANTSITFSYLLKEVFGYCGVVPAGSEAERAAYDMSGAGQGAPHTDWISRKSLRFLCRGWSTFSCWTENIAQEPPFSRWSRDELMRSPLPRLFGLDLYAVAVK